MKKIRILHIGNGKAHKIKVIIDFFKDRGHDIHFIPLPPTMEKWNGIIYHDLPPFGIFSKLQVLRNILTIRKIVKETRPDIVHAHNARGPGWYGAFCGCSSFVIHAYGSDLMSYYYNQKNIFGKLLTSYACRKADSIIVTGKHMIDASSHLKIPKNKIKLLPRGVDLQVFRKGLDTTNLKKQISAGEAAPVILSPRYQINETLYNFDTIIKSIPYVKSHYPKVLYIQLYGESFTKEKAEFEKMAIDLGVSDNYRMVRAVNNNEMPYLYNLADMIVSVTSTDGFPVTVLEASACETPIIATRLEYTKEWFVDGENGILINERDPVALSDAIVDLYRNSSLMEKMKKINRQLVEERADYTKCMLELETLYYKLLGGNS